MAPPTVEWSVESFPGELVTAARASGDTWIALGVNEAWLSIGGSQWHHGRIDDVVPPPTSTGLEGEGYYTVDLARLGATWFAIAAWNSQLDVLVPVVFSSEDGLNWTHVPSSTAWGYGPSALASNGSMLIVTNYEFGGGLGSVFVSADGVEWIEHAGPNGPATMLDVYADPEVIVAIGYRWSDQTLEIPVVWKSTDGVNWIEADPIAAERATTPWAVARTATGTFVMLTTVRKTPEGCAASSCLIHDLEAWFSADGIRWQLAEFPTTSVPFGTFRGIDVLPLADGAVAIAAGQGMSRAWTTGDGVHWIDAAFTGPPGFEASAAASSGSQIRVFDASDAVVLGTVQ